VGCWADFIGETRIGESALCRKFSGIVGYQETLTGILSWYQIFTEYAESPSLPAMKAAASPVLRRALICTTSKVPLASSTHGAIGQQSWPLPRQFHSATRACFGVNDFVERIKESTKQDKDFQEFQRQLQMLKEQAWRRKAGLSCCRRGARAFRLVPLCSHLLTTVQCARVEVRRVWGC
jgi:hypothetical protein